MSSLSTARKLGLVARIAAQQAGRSRTAKAAWGAVKTTGRSTAKTMHHLWLEVIGALFLAMAGMGAISTVREYLKIKSGHSTPGHVAVGAAFCLIFAWFGISSFLRVRRSESKRKN